MLSDKEKLKMKEQAAENTANEYPEAMCPLVGVDLAKPIQDFYEDELIRNFLTWKLMMLLDLLKRKRKNSRAN